MFSGYRRQTIVDRGGRLAYRRKYAAQPRGRRPLKSFHMYQPGRVGYRSVARARGAAVTGEMKYFDCELQDTLLAAVTTTWVAGALKDPGTTINLGSAAVATPACLFAPTVGAALNQRIGRKVKMLKVKINGTLQCDAQTAQTGVDNAPKIRVLLVQDMQTNAAAMTAAQLMRDAGGATTTISAFQNPDNFGRFKVLKDKTFVFQNPNMQTLSATNASFSQNALKRSFKLGYTFKNVVDVHFNATNGGTVADIVDHSLHVIAVADIITMAPSLAYYSRVSYKE